VDLHGAPATDLLTDVPLQASFPHSQTSRPTKRELNIVFGALLSMENTPGRRNTPCSLPELMIKDCLTLKVPETSDQISVLDTQRKTDFKQWQEEEDRLLSKLQTSSGEFGYS